METVELKSTITEMKILIDAFNGILESAEEKVNLEIAQQRSFYLQYNRHKSPEFGSKSIHLFLNAQCIAQGKSENV